MTRNVITPTDNGDALFERFRQTCKSKVELRYGRCEPPLILTAREDIFAEIARVVDGGGSLSIHVANGHVLGFTVPALMIDRES